MEKIILQLFAALILSSCQEQEPIVYGDSKGYTVRMNQVDYWKWSEIASDTTLMKLGAERLLKSKKAATNVTTS